MKERVDQPVCLSVRPSICLSVRWDEMRWPETRWQRNQISSIWKKGSERQRRRTPPRIADSSRGLIKRFGVISFRGEWQMSAQLLDRWVLHSLIARPACFLTTRQGKNMQGDLWACFLIQLGRPNNAQRRKKEHEPPKCHPDDGRRAESARFEWDRVVSNHSATLVKRHANGELEMDENTY